MTVHLRGYSWQPRGAARPAVGPIDVRIEPGERVLLVGPSGSGKSTLLSAIAGLLGPGEPGLQRGELHLDAVSGVSHAQHRSVGLLRQDPETNVLLARVADEIVFGGENLGIDGEELRRRVQACAASLDIAHLLGEHTARLSGGQKQRIAMATIAVMRPNIWLLDEPTAQLDSIGQRHVSEAVRALLRPDDTLVLVEHQLDTWWPLMTRLIALDADGTIAVDCAPTEALQRHRPTLEALGVWLPLDPGQPRPVPAGGGTELMTADVTFGRAAAMGDIDLRIAGGEAILLRGPNGSGKTTLALTVAGLLPPLQGSVQAAESWSPIRRSGRVTEPYRWSSVELASRIATVFQQPDLQFMRSTVRDEIRLGASAPDRADIVLDQLGIAHLANRHPRSLSGGEKRRVSVGTALASNANLIVADEPTFGQDRNTWRFTVDALNDAVTSGRALLAPSHDRLLGAALSARAIELAPRVEATAS